MIRRLLAFLVDALASAADMPEAEATPAAEPDAVAWAREAQGRYAAQRSAHLASFRRLMAECGYVVDRGGALVLARPSPEETAARVAANRAALERLEARVAGGVQ